MKQAIITKYIGPTNTRGARIKASCQRGSITIAWYYALNADENHAAAKNALVEKFAVEDAKCYGHPKEHNHWLRPMAHGVMDDGRHVFVFINC